MTMAGNIPSTPTDTQRWATFIGYPTRSASAERAPSRDDYLGEPRHEVRAIAARIAGSMAVVLTFTVGLGYLIVRALAS